ncbi:hypothetical protein HYC85_004652 [Camellia sinensis]|uniref:Uncharacterized protein n=1 Tax=Camellia sinensis TaxID=4442 RepID=A0A7J7HYB6_CAMSI|nr:hypothetical protein HYC85_004652 [Camellia sinensis]
MASTFPVNSVTFFIVLLSFCILSVTQSSTIGVKYISLLLEIQDQERALPSVQLSAARGVLNRLIPSHSLSFEFRIVSKKCSKSEIGTLISKFINFARALIL